MQLAELRHLIDKADAAYYSGSSSTVSDEQYDNAKKQLSTLDPNDERLTRIGLQYDKSQLRNKVRHTIPMGSLDNMDNSIHGLPEWYSKITSQLGTSLAEAGSLKIFASLKIDGSSLRAKYIKGRLHSVTTRGNGEYGEDVTINAINFQYLPLQLNEDVTCDVRGEAILYKSDFVTICERDYGCSIDDIPTDQLSNPRNVGNGIIAREDNKDARHIRFIAFNIFCDEVEYDTEYSKMQHLQRLGFTAVEHKLCETVGSVESHFQQSEDNRDNLPYEIDGMVVVINDCSIQNQLVDVNDKKTLLRPKHSRAIKFKTKKAAAKLISVNISVGHTGAIIPTGILSTTRVGGVNVTNVLLNNWDEIDRLGICINDTVDIGLAGDIIPKCYGVISQADDRVAIQEPRFCPSCGSRTTRELRGKIGAVLYCTDPVNCPEAKYGKIDRFIGSSKTGVGILGIGSSTLRAMIVDDLVKDPADLYSLKVSDIENLQLRESSEDTVRLGTSRAKMIIDNINGKRSLPLHVFLGSLGIELLGKRRVELLQKQSNGRLDTISDWLDTKSLSCMDIEGFGDAIKDAVVSGIESNRDLIAKFIANGVVIQQPEKKIVDAGGILAGYSFCFTGTRDCLADVERLGGQIKSGVSKGLSFLVQKDSLSRSNKTIKAEQYGTKIISIAYLKDVISGKTDISDCNAMRSECVETGSKPRKSVVVNNAADDLVEQLFS